MAFEVWLLGPLCVVVDGVPTPIGSPRSRMLIAALALDPGRTISAERLVEVLWGDDPPAGPRDTLQRQVAELRAVLPENVLVDDASGYRLAVSPDDTDVGRVDRLVAAARAVAATDPDVAADRLAEALDMWRGSPLADVAGNVAFSPDLARLDELRHTIGDDRHAALLAAGRSSAAVPGLESAVAEQPLRERTAMLFVDALFRAGRPAEALRAADRYRRNLVEWTGLDPGQGFLELEEQILSGVAPAAGATTPRAETSAPTLSLVGSFHGRHADLQMLDHWVRHARIVTVSGPGGVGKTRLVAEFIAAIPQPGIVTVIELAALTEGAVLDAVAAVLRVRATEAHRLEDAVVDYLRFERRLIVLDNCQHVLDDVRRMVRRLRYECPEVRVLATSRAGLGLADEHVMALGPLPTSPVGVEPAPAVALFLDRLQVADLKEAAVDMGAVHRLCAGLDGIPLALEIAARQAAAQGMAAIADPSGHTLDAPDAGRLDGERTTLLETVVGAHDLLEPESQRLFAALAVFEGGWNLDAAESVVGDRFGAPAATLLARLVDVGLVVAEPWGNSGSGEHRPGEDREIRYRMLDVVRRFAVEHLAAGPDETEIRSAHATWAADMALTLAAAAIGAHERDAVRRLDAERANLRIAVGWVCRSHDVATAAVIADALARAALYRPDAEILGWLRYLAGLVADSGGGEASEAAVVLGAAARAAFLDGQTEACAQLATDALLRIGETGRCHLAWHALGMLRLDDGDHAAAADWFMLSLADPEAPIGDRLDAYAGMALAHIRAGDHAAADEEAIRHEALARSCRSGAHLAFSRYVAAELETARRDDISEDAVALLVEAVDLAVTNDADLVVGVASMALVSALTRLGRHLEALERLPVLLDLWLRTSGWSRQWATLRLVAEVLSKRGRHREAVVAISAASRDPEAPALTEAEAERHTAMMNAATAALRTEQLRRAVAYASELSRTDVVHEMRRVIDEELSRAQRSVS